LSTKGRPPGGHPAAWGRARHSHSRQRGDATPPPVETGEGDGADRSLGLGAFLSMLIQKL